MNCDTARDALLEAELPLEKAAEKSPVAEHLRECGPCRAVAAALEDQHQAARDDYQGMRPRMSDADMASVVLQGATGRALRRSSAAGSPLRASVAHARPKRRGIVAAAFLGAAIAATVTMFVLHWDAIDSSDAGDVQAAAQRVPIEVEVPANQNAIVFETRNPNITVVWLYSGD